MYICTGRVRHERSLTNPEGYARAFFKWTVLKVYGLFIQKKNKKL